MLPTHLKVTMHLRLDNALSRSDWLVGLLTLLAYLRCIDIKNITKQTATISKISLRIYAIQNYFVFNVGLNRMDYVLRHSHRAISI